MVRAKDTTKTTNGTALQSDSPEPPLTTQQRLQILANLIVDRVLEDQKNGIIRTLDLKKI